MKKFLDFPNRTKSKTCSKIINSLKICPCMTETPHLPHSMFTITMASSPKELSKVHELDASFTYLAWNQKTKSDLPLNVAETSPIIFTVGLWSPRHQLQPNVQRVVFHLHAHIPCTPPALNIPRFYLQNNASSTSFKYLGTISIRAEPLKTLEPSSQL